MGSTGWNFHLAGIDKDLREDAAHPAYNTGALHTPGPWPRPVKTLVLPGPGHILEKQEKNDLHAGDWDRRHPGIVRLPGPGFCAVMSRHTTPSSPFPKIIFG